ncbi:2'-5' RNA ligase family protein [Tundrisphaera sp. TA3]|uniref:2'-5' RNA ligase family protein n=1 Tax=Tundrisphaera sp. TA3 TaxID=3435775 RepID=UPI003EB941A2
MPVAPDAVLLVTLGFDSPTFARLDALRRRYFPPERNFIPAHISLFHHLPGSEFATIDEALAASAASRGPIDLAFRTIRRMDRGMMAVVEAAGLAAIHARLAAAFKTWLTPQDRQPFRSHVTIMNKAERDDAARAFGELQATWNPWDGVGDRLLLWEYRGGPWDAVAEYPFSGTPGGRSS